MLQFFDLSKSYYTSDFKSLFSTTFSISEYICLNMFLYKPLHNLFLSASVILFSIAFFLTDKTLNINISTITYSILFRQIFLLAAVFLSLLWLLYTFTTRYLYSQKIYSIHVITTMILLLFIIMGALWSNQLVDAFVKDNFQEKTSLAASIGNSIIFAGITLLCIQLLYPLNLIIGIIKLKKY